MRKNIKKTCCLCLLVLMMIVIVTPLPLDAQHLFAEEKRVEKMMKMKREIEVVNSDDSTQEKDVGVEINIELPENFDTCSISAYHQLTGDAQQELYYVLHRKPCVDMMRGSFIWPVDPSIKYISSHYGKRTYIRNEKQITDFHEGIDIPSEVGTDIFAVQDGVVVEAKYASNFGNYIILNHENGVSTLYAHCSELLVEKGDEVLQGEHIAEMGATGWTTGPHLHIEIRVDNNLENPIEDGWLQQP